MGIVFKRLAVFFVVAGGFVFVLALLAPDPDAHKSGEKDESRYVHRDRGLLEDAATGRSALDLRDRTRANVDLINLKSVYATAVQQYVLDNGSMPRSMDDLVEAGLDRRYLKDTSGLDVHYELVKVNGREKARIYTYGPDFTGGTADDVAIYVP